MSNESEDIDVGGEAEDTEDPEFVDEYQEPEPTAEPEMGPPEGEGEAVPMAEGESEPMAEAGPPMGEPQQVETESSPFDNEFKTISTTDQPPPEAEEEDDVLFPDASETRAKKVGYN
jgi:hypothetical protein